MVHQSRSRFFLVNTLALGTALFLGNATVDAQNTREQAIYWPRQELAIPFQLSSLGTPPESLELEVSEDAGRSWHSVTKADPTQKQFQFQTQRDGDYWFRVKSLDQSGQVVDQPGEAMHIVIDSTKPVGQLLIDLDRKGDLQAEFRIVEASLDHSSIRLEYQTELDTAWKEVNYKTEKGNQENEWVGSATWTIPHQAAQLIVRLTGRDQAGNGFEVTRMPKLPKTASGLSGAMKFASTKQDGAQAPVGSGVAKPTLTLPAIPGGLNLAPPAPKKTSILGTTSDIPADKPQMFTSTGLPVRSIEDLPPASLSRSEPIPKQVSELPALEPPVSNPSNAKPNALHSSSRSFELDYEIVNDPGSPIASIELWGTLDQGKTWERWGVDADRQSPFDIEVDTEGLFGFRMVIVGSNGLASRRPLPGDSADAWIHVDTTMPRARILSALAGKASDAGSLVIEYQAIDDYFIDRPISLYYSETMQGPWVPITQGAKNQGRFAWSGESHLPEKVYLKLQATDAAGNVGEHILDLPVDVQSAAPRGKIQGFRPR